MYGYIFEADEHAAAGLVQRPQHLQLHAVELGGGVGFAHQQQLGPAHPRGELRRRDRGAGRGVEDRVDRDRQLPGLPSRIADLEPVEGVVGAGCPGTGDHENEGDEGSHTATILLVRGEEREHSPRILVRRLGP